MVTVRWESSILLTYRCSWLFFTDWLRNSMQTPYIARAYSDGSNVTKIREHELGWPNGLCIDFAANRLYWVDAFFDRYPSIARGSHERLSLIKCYNIKCSFSLFPFLAEYYNYIIVKRICHFFPRILQCFNLCYVIYSLRLLNLVHMAFHHWMMLNATVKWASAPSPK